MEREVQNANELLKRLKLVMERRGRIHQLAKKIEHYEHVRDEYFDRLSDCIDPKKEFCRNLDSHEERLMLYCTNVDGYTEQEDCEEFDELCSRTKDFHSMYNNYGEDFALLFKAGRKVDDAIAGIRSRKSQKTVASVRVYKNPRKHYKFHHYR